MYCRKFVSITSSKIFTKLWSILSFLEVCSFCENSDKFSKCLCKVWTCTYFIMHLFSLPLCGKSSVFYRAIGRVHKWIARTFTPSNIKQVKVCVLSLVSLFKQSNQPRNDVWSSETSLQWVTSCWHFLHCQVWQRRLRPEWGLKAYRKPESSLLILLSFLQSEGHSPSLTLCFFLSVIFLFMFYTHVS